MQTVRIWSSLVYLGVYAEQSVWHLFQNLTCRLVNSHSTMLISDFPYIWIDTEPQMKILFCVAKYVRYSTTHLSGVPRSMIGETRDAQTSGLLGGKCARQLSVVQPSGLLYLHIIDHTCSDLDNNVWRNTHVFYMLDVYQPRYRPEPCKLFTVKWDVTSRHNSKECVAYNA